MTSNYLNYNIKSYGSLKAIRSWRDETGIPIRVFENFDAGGFNFYIVEFERREDLDRFIDTGLGFDTPWGEDENGHHMLLG